MDCADYRIDCDGDSDGNGNDLLYGVLDKKSVLEIFPERFELILGTDLHGFKLTKKGLQTESHTIY